MSKKRRDTPEEAVDRAVGRVAEATGTLTGDETIEAEGGARWVRWDKGTPCAWFHSLKQDGSWKPEEQAKSRAFIGRKSKP